MEDMNYLGAEGLPDIDNLLIEDDEPELDERYLRQTGDVDEIKRNSAELDTHLTLSKELNGSRYQIRSPEQQAAWTEKKTNNHIMMGCFVLRFRFVMEALLDECRSKHVNKIFGQFETKKVSHDKISRRIQYSVKYNDEMATLIDNYLKKSPGAMDIVSLTETLTGKYNLKYQKFIKPWCQKVIAMFDHAKAQQNAYINTQSKGGTLDLFNSTCREVREMEKLCNLSWSMIANVIRQIRILLAIADELRSRLVCTNLRSCIFAARNYYRKCGLAKNASISDNDLIDEAVIGLMHAADLYVHGNSARFTTYAEEWVQLNISRHAKKNNPVLLPIHATDLANRIIRNFKEREADGRLERIPDKMDVEAELGLTKPIPHEIWRLAALKYQGFGIATNCSTTGAEDDNDTASIDFFARDEGGEKETQIQMLASKIFGYIDEMVNAKDEKIRITPLQKQFLVMRYREDYLNREIAEEHYGTSDAKYVRAELNKAFKKLKIMLKMRNIHDFPL